MTVPAGQRAERPKMTPDLRRRRLLWIVAALPVVVSGLACLWALGVAICLSLGLSDGLSTALGLLFVPAWLLALAGLMRWKDEIT